MLRTNAAPTDSGFPVRKFRTNERETTVSQDESVEDDSRMPSRSLPCDPLHAPASSEIRQLSADDGIASVDVKHEEANGHHPKPKRPDDNPVVWDRIGISEE